MSDDPGQGRVEPRHRAIGYLPFLLFLGSAPLGLFGLLFYLESADSEGATPLSGLSGVGVLIGIGIIVAAVVALVAGSTLFIRSAKD